jgi:hypothetical protein
MNWRMLWWDGNQGAAHGEHGVARVAVQLFIPPRLPGCEFWAIDYIPRIRQRMLRSSGDQQWREMTPAEVTLADDAIDRMVRLACQALGVPPAALQTPPRDAPPS